MDNDFQLNDDDDEDDTETWDKEAEWNNDGDEGEGDVKDDNADYLEFLNDEVKPDCQRLSCEQAHHFCRRKNSAQVSIQMMMTWQKRAC